MSVCDPVSCEHFKALHVVNGNFLAIQNENNDLKREIDLLRSGKIPCLPNKETYYQRWLETDKENQNLSTKITDSKRLVADLQPKLAQILQSIQNIEQTLDFKKVNQGQCTPSSESEIAEGKRNIVNAAGDQQHDECTALQNESYYADKNGTEDMLQSPEKSKSDALQYNVDEATDTEDISVLVNVLENAHSSDTAVQVIAPNQTAMVSDLAVVRLDDVTLEEIPEEKPVFVDCSICHENFPHYSRPEMNLFQGPPCCEKCKLPVPATGTSGPRGITFQYPKGISSASTEFLNADLNDMATQYSSHIDNKSYQCQMCGKKFTRSHGLKKHIRIHTGEKPYICKICGKSFAVSGRLALHIRIHTGEKPYECKFCGKRFNESSKLKIHYRRHTGEKPFTCEVCDKGFSQMSTLTAHCRRHLTETKNQCGKCGNGFRNPNALRGHRCLQICDANIDVQNKSETILGNDR